MGDECHVMRKINARPGGMPIPSRIDKRFTISESVSYLGHVVVEVSIQVRWRIFGICNQLSQYLGDVIA